MIIIATTPQQAAGNCQVKIFGHTIESRHGFLFIKMINSVEKRTKYSPQAIGFGRSLLENGQKES